MDEQTIRRVNVRRLANWTDALVERNATAAVLIAMGHGDEVGNVTVLVPTDAFDDRTLRAVLLYAAARIDAGEHVVTGE